MNDTGILFSSVEVWPLVEDTPVCDAEQARVIVQAQYEIRSERHQSTGRKIEFVALQHTAVPDAYNRKTFVWRGSIKFLLAERDGEPVFIKKRGAFNFIVKRHWDR